MDKHVYLDVDMDYFVAPIENVSVDNVRLYHNRSFTAMPVEPVVRKLKECGLKWEGSKISCFTNHKTSYTHWWISKKQDDILIHIDAHSDMYRNSHRDLRKLSNGDIGCYNYIWYAIRDGYVSEVYWVIPESIKELLEQQNAHRIINKELIVDSFKDDGGLHIIMDCVLATGEAKQIPVHVCTIDMLPKFSAACDKVTLATSPEFIPADADELVFEYIEVFGASKDVAQNIFNQHKAMLNKTPDELQEAWEKIGKK